MAKNVKLTYLKKSIKFSDKAILTESQVDELIVKFIKKLFYNIDTNIDFKQMKGNMQNIYRIRKANLRIIVKVIDDEIIVEAIIQDIGFRGDIYK